MPALLILLLFGIEFAVLWLAADLAGGWPLPLWGMAVTSFLGISLLGKAGQRANLSQATLQSMMRGGDVLGGIAETFAPMIAGALLLFPGFVSDAIALLFLIPVTRRPLARGCRKLVGAVLTRGMKKMGMGGGAGGMDIAAMMRQMQSMQAGNRVGNDASPFGDGSFPKRGRNGERVIDADFEVKD